MSQKVLFSALAMDQYPVATYPGYFYLTICAFDTKWPQDFGFPPHIWAVQNKKQELGCLGLHAER